MASSFDADRPVDQLVKDFPEVVRFLIEHDLPCVVCGEPFWGTLRELAHQKGWSDERVQQLVEEFVNRH